MAAERDPIRVELVGFDPRHRATLDVLFAGPGRGACVIVDHDDAQAAVIDVDRIGGLAGWQAFRRSNPERPTAIVSIYESNRLESEVFLRKPVKVDDMLDAVARLRARLPRSRPAPAGTQWPALEQAANTAAAPRPAQPPSCTLEPATSTRLVAPDSARAMTAAATGAAPGSAPAVRRACDQGARSSAGRDRGAAPERATLADGDPETFAPQLAALSPAAQAVPAALACGPAAASGALTACTAPGQAGANPVLPPRLLTGPLPVAPPATTPEERALCGAASDIDCTDPRAVETLWFDTAGSLYAAIRTAVRSASREQCSYLLSYEGQALLCADGVRQEVILYAPKDHLRQLCAEEGANSKVGSRRVPQAPAGATTLAMEAVVWEASLWTYRGRLPAGTDLAARVRLNRWPNFTRLAELPQSLRIAALLSQQALPLPFIAEALRIPQRHVFAFYGAAHELGIAEQIQRDVPNTPAHAGAPMTKRLWRRLRGLFPDGG